MNRSKAPWLEPEQQDSSADFLEFTGGNSFLAGELILRGIHTIPEARAFLEPANYQPSSPYDLEDMDIAVDLLVRAIKTGDLIGVWGDFDVDGQTSTTILVEGLQKFGALVKYHIPVRGVESHGINIKVLEQFLGNDVDLLLTCDTGITAHESVGYAKSRGIKVIVTDHHSLPDKLPGSDANINPRRLAADHPLAYLCGAGTAFKLVEALFNSFQQGSGSSELLDLVALGTIADVAELRGDNRYLVQMGLEKLRRCKRPAIKAMAEAAGITLDSINEEHISFALAPRLNAIGRLGDANPIVKFLTSSDNQEINGMASHLEGLNIHRRLIVDQVVKSAQDQLDRNPDLLNDPIIILENPQWPGGVVGIAASRLVELYHLPTILLTTKGGTLASGSARSVEGIDISVALGKQSSLLHSFGGHPKAAGLALPVEKIPDLRRGLAETISNMTLGMDLTPHLQIHGYLNLEDIDPEITGTLDLLAPYGPGNPLPVLVARNMTIVSAVPVGRTEDHTQLILQNPRGDQFKVIWWKSSGMPVPEGFFDLAYSIRKSNYRGQEEVQVQWVDFRQTDFQIYEEPRQKLKLELVDQRLSHNQEESILNLIQDLEAQVWAERVQPYSFPCINRLNIKPAETLILASIPPSLQVLQKILSISKPEKIFLFNLDPENDSMQAFLHQLSGLVLFSINQRGGWLKYEELAARLCHSDDTVQSGIQWLVYNGTIRILDRMGDTIQVGRDGTKDHSKLSTASRKLKDRLDETRAFRSYYLSAPQSLWLTSFQEPGQSKIN